MRTRFFTLLAVCFTLAVLGIASTASAKKVAVPKMYMFGFAASFTDSIVHFTDIQEVDSAWIDTKSKFLLSREEYSYQLRDYLNEQQQIARKRARPKILMATNYDEFMEADQAESAATEASLTPEMREVLGIEPGRDGYMRWLLSLGGYEYILKLDTGLGDKEEFERDLQKVSERTRLKIKVAEDGWVDLQPTEDLYKKCKSFLQA